MTDTAWCSRILPAAGDGDVLHGWPCSALTFTTDELLAVAEVDEEEAYRHLDAALSRSSSSRRERATGSGTRWCARR